MAEQEKPQGPKRRSSHKSRRAAASGTVVASHETSSKDREGLARGKARPAAPAGKTREALAAARSGGTKPSPSQSASTESKAGGWIEELGRYLKSVKAEFLRVTWPSKQDLKVATTVVVLTLVVLTVYLYVVNVFFNAAFERLGG